MTNDDEAMHDEAGALRALPVIAETVDVQKRIVDGGGYRLTKRVSTHDEVVDEPLEAVHVDVERRTIDRWLPDGVVPAPRIEGDTTIFPVCEEVIVTQKRLMLREEVRVTRTARVHRDPTTVSLRREDVVVERLPAAATGPANHPSAPTEPASDHPPIDKDSSWNLFS